MLLGLEIRDMLIIDRLELEFQPGLNVLTGETGAGKSILLDSLGFVLGWRGRAELVRKGADQGEVTAVFSLPSDHPARVIIRDAGLPDGDELILRRTNTPDGRKTARINDRRASGELLRQLSETLVELHGQQDDRGLLNPSSHRKILDEFGNLQRDIKNLSELWAGLAAAQKDLDLARAALARVQDEEDYLRHALEELDNLSVAPGDEAALDAKRRLMQAAEKIGEDIKRAAAALGSAGAESQMIDAQRWLEDAAPQAGTHLDDPLSALSRAIGDLGLAQQGVDQALVDMSFDAHDLETTEERLFAIRALARKHDVLADELPNLRADLHRKVAALEGGAADIAALNDALQQAQSAYDTAAAKLTGKREKAALKLDKSMAHELAPLKMERAVFSTAVSSSEPGPQGVDQVTFHVATNPGAPAGPLNKIASGGELSRFLLALKVCLTGSESGLTMIFDEIDRGVGGATADAVGRRLAQLAEGGQLLVVTHSPQVAARGAHHWRVEKSVTKGQTLSRVVPLDPAARVDEIARMLAADSITDEARAAARSLLKP